MILKNNKWIEAEPEDQREIAETREVMDDFSNWVKTL